MSNISAAAVNEVRKRTDLPLMKCKDALVRAGGDVEKAIELIRIEEKGVRVKMAGRETAEGRVAIYIDSAKGVGAILDMRCETAPTAKNDMFVKLATELAKQVALNNPASIDELLAQPSLEVSDKTINDRITDVMAVIRENMKPARFERLTGILGQYIHHDGMTGVLLQAKGATSDPSLLRDVCMHIVAAVPIPMAVRREEIPAEIVNKELEIAKAKAMQTGKPDQIAEKIALGQMNAWYGENVLIEQPFVKETSKTVGVVLQAAGLEAVKFVRYRVGEGATPATTEE